MLSLESSIVKVFGIVSSTEGLFPLIDNLFRFVILHIKVSNSKQKLEMNYVGKVSDSAGLKYQTQFQVGVLIENLISQQTDHKLPHTRIGKVVH